MKRAVLKSVALLALMTGAATAQSVSGGISGGSSVTAGGASVEAGVDVTANAEAGTATGDPQFEGVKVTGSGALDTTLAAEAVNQAVVTADGTVLGTVEQVDTATDGRARLIVALSNDLGLEVKRVAIGANAATEVNSETGIRLSLTEAEFRSKLESGAAASAGTATN